MRRVRAARRFRSIFIAFGLLLALALAQPAVAQELLGLAGATEEPDSKSERPIAVTRAPEEDQLLAKRLGEIFAEVDGLENIQIEARSGVVVLSGEVLSNEAHQKAVRIAGKLEGVVEIKDEIRDSRDVQARLSPVLEGLRERVLSFLAGVPLLLVSLGVFVLFLVAGRLVSRRESLFRRLTVNAFARELLQQAVRVGFVLLGAVMALEILDATAIVAAVAGVAGLAGLAVSFAFRDLAENYIASVLLSLRQPFQADEHVRIEGHEGRVVRLTSRATILIDLDGNHVRIPNAAVFKRILLNYSRNPQRRFGFSVGVANETNLAAAVALGVERLTNMPGIVAEPAPAPDISSDDEILAAVERDRTRAEDDLLDEERPLE